MRLFVLALMIALLPLRGWAGEVMATEMASSQTIQAHKAHEFAAEPTTYFVAASADFHWAKADFSHENRDGHQQKPLTSAKAASKDASGMQDCDSHAKADGSDSSTAHCDTCPACQACHTVAMSAAAVTLNLTYSAQALQSPAEIRFVSATASLGQKPPIS